MNTFKCAFYMMMGAGIALIYKEYEKEIMCACTKMMKKEKQMLKDGLNLE